MDNSKISARARALVASFGALARKNFELMWEGSLGGHYPCLRLDVLAELFDDNDQPTELGRAVRTVLDDAMTRSDRAAALRDRVAHLNTPTEDMRRIAQALTVADRGELLALAQREWVADPLAIRALSPHGLLDECGNVMVDGLDLAGALLRWPWSDGRKASNPWHTPDGATP